MQDRNHRHRVDPDADTIGPDPDDMATMGGDDDAPPTDAPRTYEPTDQTPVDGDLFEDPSASGKVPEESLEQEGIPDRIDHYRIEGTLGGGGMGIVLLATDTRSGKKVAIKTVRAEDSGRRFVREALEREGRTSKKLDHPHILPVYDVVTSGTFGRPYYTMAYMPKGGLERKARRGESVNLDRLLTVAIQIADALAYAHDTHGVVHRDIKPDNILLDDQHNAYVCDFGLVKGMHNQTISDGQMPLRNTVGTIPYMAPEVARGNAGDYRVDIYSFGAMLYRLVTGRLPFLGQDTTVLIEQVKTECPPPLRTLNGNLPKGWITVIEGAMARELADRYATMADMKRDLERLRDGEKPLGPSGRRRRSPVLPIVLAAGAALAIVGAGVTWMVLQPTTPAGAPRLVLGDLPVRLDEGDPVTLRATATDDEDGDLSSSITWASSVDGPFADAGSEITVVLSAGRHDLTARVVDSDQYETTRKATIDVVGEGAAPVLRISSPADGAEFDAGAAIPCVASARDEEDGDLASRITWTVDGTTMPQLGARVQLDGLTEGSHLVRAAVEDDDGARAAQEITIVIRAAAALDDESGESTDDAPADEEKGTDDSGAGEIESVVSDLASSIRAHDVAAARRLAPIVWNQWIRVDPEGDARGALRDAVATAAASGDVEIFRALGPNAVNDRRFITTSGLHPIHIASSRDRADLVRYFVEEVDRGLRDTRTAVDNRTPLHVAADAGAHEVLRALLELETDPASRTASGRTALHLACEGGFRDIAESLLDAMRLEDATVLDDRARNAMHWAVASGHVDLVILLHDQPVRWDRRDADRMTPLELARDLHTFDGDAWEEIIGILEE